MEPRFGNESDCRYFEIFCSKTAYEILPCFDVDVIRLMLLQACESEPCIRSAVVAIGALDKTFQTAQDVENIYFDDPSVKPSEHHRHALRQYSRAVKQMRAAAAGGKMSLRTMLLTCLVILAFEAWNGSQQLAVQQIQTAIGLIQDWKTKTRTKTRSLLEFKEPNSDVVEDNLIQIFSQLAIQVVFFAEKRSAHTGEILENESMRLLVDETMPEVFSSYREAFLYHRNVTRRSTGFLSRSVPKSRAEYPGWLPSEEERARDIQLAADRENLVATALHWFKAFEPVSKLWTDSATRLWVDPRTLRVQMLVVYVSLCVMSTSEETAYDAYTDVFSDMADLSAEVVAAKHHRRWLKRTNFSFDSGIIIPLYLAVMKCRDRVVRRRIINVLVSTGWREGLWDSVFAGRLGQWAMEIEEGFLEDDHVPGWARISGVTWKSDLQQRMAVLTCRQRRSEHNEEMRTRTKTITW